MLNEKRTITFFSPSIPNLRSPEAMGHLRGIAPYQMIGYQLENGNEGGDIGYSKIEFSDAILIQRNFPSDFTKYKKIKTYARKKHKPIIFEIDDLIFQLPDNHPDRINMNFSDSLLPMFQALVESDLVTVSTSRLKLALSSFNKNIHVIPNYFDESIWRFRSPEENNSQNDNIVIGFMGTESHKADLQSILPVLIDIIDMNKKDLLLRFWGVKPPDQLISRSNVEWIPTVPGSYYDFTEFFQCQEADIFIAPLVDNEFNSCKSSIKFLEYSALGVPGVYSSIEPYLNVITDGYNGFLAKSLDDWKLYLTMLINNQSLRNTIAENAQKFIRNNFILSENKGAIVDKIIPFLEVNEDNQQSPLLKILESINSQLNILHVDYHEKKQKLKSKEMEIRELEEEVLSYVMSSSWKLTRPLRLLTNKIKGK